MIHPNALAASRRHVWLGPAMVLALGLLIVAWFLPTMTIERVPWVWRTKFSIWRVVEGLWSDREYFIAAVLVLFSVVFPVVKLLAGLWVWARVDVFRAGASRVVGFIGTLGKWSMVDVFVVALVVAAIQVSLIANVAIHAGIYVFSAAVLASIALLHFLERALAKPRLHVTT
ncbi:MAG: paraquat-inducible protein A [Alphaproteobacteria bacterium]